MRRHSKVDQSSENTDLFRFILRTFFFSNWKHCKRIKDFLFGSVSSPFPIRIDWIDVCSMFVCVCLVMEEIMLNIIRSIWWLFNPEIHTKWDVRMVIKRTHTKYFMFLMLDSPCRTMRQHHIVHAQSDWKANRCGAQWSKTKIYHTVLRWVDFVVVIESFANSSQYFRNGKFRVNAVPRLVHIFFFFCWILCFTRLSHRVNFNKLFDYAIFLRKFYDGKHPLHAFAISYFVYFDLIWICGFSNSPYQISACEWQKKEQTKIECEIEKY